MRDVLVPINKRWNIAALLEALRGKDVLLVFVESYGRVAVQDSSVSPRINVELERGAAALRAAGAINSQDAVDFCLSEVERGERNISVDNMEALALALEMELPDLMRTSLLSLPSEDSR